MVDCREVAKRASRNRLSETQIDEILQDLEAVKKSKLFPLSDAESAIFIRGETMRRDADLAQKIEKRNRYMNILKEQRLMALTKRADEAVGNPSLGLESALVGVNSPFFESGRSVAAIGQALESSYFGGLINDLKTKGLLTKYDTMKGDFEKSVAMVLGDLNRKEPRGVPGASADAKAIAEIMFKYQRAALQRENQAGAYIRLKQGRVVGTVHDRAKMLKANKDAWKDTIRDKLDYENMEIAPERIEGFLDSAYRALTTGVRKTTHRTEISKAFKGTKNLARQESEGSLFIFNDAESWYEYDQQFGRASLRESFTEDLQSAARATALLEIFGTNPEAMMNRVIKRLEEKYSEDPQKLKDIQRRQGRYAVNFKSALDEVTGEVNDPYNVTSATIMKGLRDVQTLSKMGGVFIASLADIAFISSSRIYQGRSLLDAWADGFSAVIKGAPKGRMREYADRLGAGLEGQLGNFVGRFNAADDFPGATSKLMRQFFKLNLLGPWTDSNKRGVALMISNDLGIEAANKFDKVPEDLKRILSIYGVGKEQWDIARKATEKGPDGRIYLMPDKIEDQRVKESMYTLLVSEVDNSVISPGAREKAMVRRGYRPGTIGGEVIRTMGQFKSFGITAISKVYGRHLYGYGAKSWTEQVMRGVGANMALINTIVGTTVLGYFVMQLKELAKGRDLRPPTSQTLFAAMLQGGGAGIYGDFLFGEANRYGKGMLSTVAGPGATTIFDFADNVNKTREVMLGGDGNVLSDWLRLFKSNLPYGNLFYVKPALDYLLWYQLQETINPGYLRRMERRIERENDQTFYIPPSSIVQTGGGFR